MSVIPRAFVRELEARNLNADRFDVFPVTQRFSRPMARLSDAGIPRKPDGTPNLTAQSPRTPNSQPDLSGLWMPEGDPTLGGSDPLPRFFLDIFGRLTPKIVPAELTPAAAQIYVRNCDNVGKLNPASNCLPLGSRTRIRKVSSGNMVAIREQF